MPLSLDTPIMGSRPNFDAGQILARMRSPDAKDRGFFVALATWCRVAGIDPAVPSAQFLVETGDGTSVRWNRDLNASGMGIVSDGTAQPFKITSVDEAARLFVQCLYALVHRRAHPEIPLSGDAGDWFEGVWLPKVRSGAMPDVRTLGDLGLRYVQSGDSRATWSWEDGKVPQDTYGKKLISRLKAFYPDLPERSNAEEPPVARDPYDLIREFVVDAHVTKQYEGQGFTYGDRDIVGLAEHETQGIMTGPQRQAFFSCPGGGRCGDALVDYGIPRNERKIYVFQDPFETNRIPWASGGSAASITQTARKASAQMGNPAGGVNSFYAAVEIEKNRGQAMTSDQIEMTARLLAYVCAMNGYPANDWKYPDVHANNVPTSVNHSDLYTSTNCRINDDDRLKFENLCTQFLTQFYGGTLPGGGSEEPVPPAYAPPAKVDALEPFMTADPASVPAVVRTEGSDWIFVNDVVKVTQDTPRLQRASPEADKVGPVVQKGEDFTAKFLVKASAGDWYYLTRYWTRVQVAHTTRSKDTP